MDRDNFTLEKTFAMVSHRWVRGGPYFWLLKVQESNLYNQTSSSYITNKRLVMARKVSWGFWGGMALIGLGILFMLGQLLRFDVMHYLWPFFILGVGAAFFIGMAAGGRAMGALAVPGSVITTVGLILFFQNLFGLWATWSYAWALIICGAGVGLMIFGSWSQTPDLRRAGRVVIGVGLALFFVFGLFFELGASILGMHSPGGVFWALALILVGLYVLFGRSIFNQVSGPVSRSKVDLTGGVLTKFTAAPGMAASAPSMEVVSEAPTATGSQPVSTSAVVGIKRLSFHSLGDITILQGEREDLEIEASQAARERIRSTVRGDTLEIRYEQDWLDWLNPRYWSISGIHYTLSLRDLEWVDAAGLGNLVITGLSTPRLELLHNGAGNVTVRRLAVEELVARQAGLGNIEVEGKTGRQSVELTGAGSYHASRLESSAASVHLSGLGSAKVRASETSGRAGQWDREHRVLWFPAPIAESFWPWQRATFRPITRI